MTLSEFQSKYLALGRVEYHSFGTGALYQCVDLANQYIKDVLGKTPIIGANAKDFPSRAITTEFEWIPNGPSNFPLKGDIPIWNGNVGGGAGHIAIALEGNANSFKSLDQNWSIVERITIENHNYNNVMGWLRVKGGATSNMVQVEDAKFRELVSKATKYDAFVAGGFVDIAAVQAKISQLEADLKAKDAEIARLKAIPVGNPETEKKLNDLKLALKAILG